MGRLAAIVVLLFAASLHAREDAGETGASGWNTQEYGPPPNEQELQQLKSGGYANREYSDGAQKLLWGMRQAGGWTSPSQPPEGWQPHRQSAAEGVRTADRPTPAPKPVESELTPVEQETVTGLAEGADKLGEAAYAQTLSRLLDMDAQRAAALLEQVRNQNNGQPPNLPASFLQEWARRNPQSPMPDSAMGAKGFQDGDFKGSRDSYDRAIKKGGENSENYVGRGLASERLGDHGQAAQDAAKALTLEPGNPNAEALLKLSQSRIPAIQLGAKPMASGDFDGGGAVAASAGPQRPAMARAAPANAAAPYAPGAGPSASDGMQNAGRFLREAARALHAGDNHGAIQAATRALGQFPRSAQALNLRAMARERAGDKRGAVADASSALKINPGNAATLTTRSWARSGLGDFAAAQADAEAAAKAEPDNAFAQVALARAAGGRGRRSEMLAALKIAAGLDPRFEDTLAEASRLPDRSDTELLFKGLVSAPKREVPERPKRFFAVVVSALVGGLLIAAGLLSVLSPSAKSITQEWRRRLGAAFGQAPAPTGKFWEYYAHKRELGSGGMGVVYEAVDQSLGRRVAVKQMRGEIRDDPREREWFIKEARVVAALHHPNIVDIYSIIEDESELYLVFEYVEGKTLERIIEERGRLGLQEAAGFLKGVCAGVQHAHDKGIIHRDLKPSNIIVDEKGDAKVMDFGIARQARGDSKTLKLTGTIVGTPAYMAPEAEDGASQKASDVFSIGVCLYELVTGTVPYEGPPSVLHASKLHGKLTPPSKLAPTLPRDLDAVAARALHPTPSARYETPALLAAEIERVSRRA